MDESGHDLDVHRAGREEAVCDRPERLTEPVTVREPGDTHGKRPGARLDPIDERFDRVPQRRLERRARTAVRLQHLELVLAVAEESADELLLLGGRLPREQAAVDRDVADGRHDVPLLRCSHHRRRERHREQRLDHVREHRRGLTRTNERVGGGARLLAGDRLDEGLHLGDQVTLGSVGAELLDQRRRLDERVVRDVRHRRVAAAAVDAQTERRTHLLRGRTRVERLSAEFDPVPGALVDAVVRAHGVGMRLAQPLGAEAGADLLVGCRGEDQVARRLESLARQ